MSDERKTQDHTAAQSPTEAASEPAVPGSGDSASRSDRESDVRTATASAERSPHPESDSSETQFSTAQPSTAQPSDTADAPLVEPVAAEAPVEPGVYFFPDRVVTQSEAHRMLDSDSLDDRAQVVSRLLTYAEYDEIWSWTDRDTVRELFDRLDLPERLRTAWARNLGLVAQSS